MKIKIINGPNLNLLGQREKNIYGQKSLEDLKNELNSKFGEQELIFFQSNSEGEIIDAIQSCLNEKIDAIIINAGAYTHYSYAIRDAIASVELPTIEVHLSNIYARELFRRNSVISDVCIGSISGFGFWSYILAIEFFLKNKV